MRLGDRAFVDHANEGKEIVGIVEVVREYYPDPSDPAGRFGMVDVTAVKPMARPVTLAEVKADPALQDIALVRQSRLSLQPVTAAEPDPICRLGGADPAYAAPRPGRAPGMPGPEALRCGSPSDL